MSILTEALPGVLGPAFAAGGTALAVGGLWRRDSPPRRATAAAALGLGVGYVVGHRVVAGSWPPVPFGDATLAAQQWRCYAAGIGALVGVSLAALRLPRPVDVLVGVLWAALVLRAVLDARFRHTWEAAEGWLRVGLLALGVGLVRALVDRRGERRGPFVAFELWALATGTSVCFQIAHNSSNAQLGGALAASLGAIAVLAWWSPAASAARGASALAVPLLGAMWVEGTVYGDVPIVAFAVLAAAPLLRALVARSPLARGKGVRGVVLEVLTLLAVVAAGVVCAQVWTPERTPYLPG